MYSLNQLEGDRGEQDERSTRDFPPIYGLDLVTDSAGPLVDPMTDRITGVGLSGRDADSLFLGEEFDILLDLEAKLQSVEAGVIATWHGSILALPLIAARAKRIGAPVTLELQIDQRSAPPSPIEGVASAFRARWGAHQTLDLRRVYQEGGRRFGRRTKNSEEDLIPPTDYLVERDPSRDAALARALTERRWPQARRHLDRLSSEPTAVSVTSTAW